MSDVVVTGGEGFLGRHLVEQLVRDGQDVCATYNYEPPEDTRHLKGLSHFRFDVTDFNQCLKLINQESPKIVYHLVAQPIVTAALRHPLIAMELTVRGSYNILEAIRQTGKDVKAIVYVSSDKVYGSNLNAKETDVLAGTDHPYNTAKIAGDVIAQMYAKAYGLPIVISRSANLYGGGDFHWDRLVPSTIKSILEDTAPVLRSDGKQIRDYIFIDDSVAGLMYMAKDMSEGNLTKGEIFNFGSNEMFPAWKIVDKLLSISSRVDLVPVIQNRVKNEILEQHIDYSHAKDRLGWEPHIGIDEGLQKTFSWYKKWFERN